jgi:hypothetical protein
MASQRTDRSAARALDETEHDGNVSPSTPRDKRMTVRRWARIEGAVTLCLFAAAATMLAFYLVVTYRSMIHSDAAMKLTLAQEMATQWTLFPRGWNYVNDIVIIFPTLISAPLSLLFAPSFPLHAFVDVVAAGFVLLAAYLAARAVGIEGPLRWLPATMLASGLSPDFAEAVFGQSAYSGTVLILLLIAGSAARFLAEPSQGQTQSRARRDLAIIALLIIGGVAGGQRGIATYAAPLMLALVAYRMISVDENFAPRQRAQRLFALSIVATVAGGFAFVALMHSVNFHQGAIGQPFSTNAQIINHMALVTGNWLTLFDALPPGGQRFSVLVAALFAIRMTICVVVFFLPLFLLACLNSLSAQLRFLVLLHVSILAATLYMLLFTGILVDEARGAPRYLVPMIPTALLVFALWLQNVSSRLKLNDAILGCCASLALLLLSPMHLVAPAFANWPYVSQGFRQNPHADIARFLEDSGLHKGFAGYWNAGITTVLTGGHVQVAPVSISDGALPVPFHHLTAEHWYAVDPSLTSSFLLLDQADQTRLNRPALDMAVGMPMRTLKSGGYDVLVYPFDISERLGFASEAYVALPRMTAATCAAEFAPLEESLVLAPHAFAALRVHATNRSSITWSQNSHPYFDPGMRILDAGGHQVAEFRAGLPKAVPPGENVELTLPFRAPALGEYTLYFSFVAEGDAWCGALTSNWVKVHLSVKS